MKSNANVCGLCGPEGLFEINKFFDSHHFRNGNLHECTWIHCLMMFAQLWQPSPDTEGITVHLLSSHIPNRIHVCMGSNKKHWLRLNNKEQAKTANYQSSINQNRFQTLVTAMNHWVEYFFTYQIDWLRPVKTQHWLRRTPIQCCECWSLKLWYISFQIIYVINAFVKVHS